MRLCFCPHHHETLGKGVNLSRPHQYNRVETKQKCTPICKAYLAVEWIKESRILVKSLGFGERQTCRWNWAFVVLD